MEKNDIQAKLTGWLHDALERSDITQATLAKLLEQRLNRRFYRTTTGLMVSGKRAIAADELLAIAEITGVPLPATDNSVEIDAGKLELLEGKSSVAIRLTFNLTKTGREK